MAKVSVIIPVYGVEKYIERCARSLFEQTFDDMEFIFIDDCTPDRSIENLKTIIKDYPQREPQIRIERMPVNSGLAAVRKYGVSCATGDYLIACDSDDYVEHDMYEKLYELAVKDNLDLVQCDIDVVDEKKVIRTLTASKSYLSSDELKNMIIDGEIANSLCNKLVRKSIYQNKVIVFPIAGMDEDNTMACQLAFFSQSLGYIKRPFYKAYSNARSMSREPGEEKIYKRYKESLSNSQIAVKFLTEHGYDNDSIAVLRAKIRPKNALWPIVRNRKYIREWRSIYPEIDLKVLFNQKVPRNTRIKFALVLSRLALLRH